MRKRRWRAKSADAALKAALTNYATATSADGDGAMVRAHAKSAFEAVAIAQQTIAGQFWTEPSHREVVEKLPKA